MKLQISLFAAITSITLLVRHLLADKYLDETHSLELIQQQIRLKEISSFWSALYYYADVHNPEALNGNVSSILTNTTFLSERQREALEPSLRQSFSYLTHPTLDGYLSLRTATVSHQFHLNPQASNVLGAHGFDFTKLAQTSDPKSCGAALWSIHTNVPALVRLARKSTKAAPLSSSTLQALRQSPAFQGFNILAEPLNLGFSYPESSPKEGLTPFLLVSFFGELSSSTNCAPMHLVFQWSDPDTKWIPTTFYTDILHQSEHLIF